MGAFGTGIQDVDLRQRQQRAKNFGQQNSDQI